MKKILITLSILSGLTLYFGHNLFMDNHAILPENDMWIGVNDKSANSTINEAQFNSILNTIEQIYAPIVEEMGGKLEFIRKWEDGTVNAYASRSGKTYNVTMFGGLARHPQITPDGFALVACHELGHHIGGMPKIKGILGFLNRWASNEGQSDYWATLKCARKIFANDNNVNIINSLNVPAVVKTKCVKFFTDKNDRAICQRSAMGGLSLATVLNALGNGTTPVDFVKPDSSVVFKTYNKHPKAQCRLDTYFAGSICDVSVNLDVDNSKDPHVGTCSELNNYTTETGSRPLCWYKPPKR